MGTTLTHSPVAGDGVTIRASRLKTDGTFPAASIVTVATTAVAATDTTLTCAALTEQIPANSWLLFTDPTTGAETRVKVTATAEIGATSLTIDDGNGNGSPVAIPVGNTAQFPGELMDRSDSSISNSNNLQSFATYNSGGYNVKLATITDSSLTLPGFFQENNAAAKTLIDAAIDKSPVYVRLEYPAPGGYSTGRIVEVLGTVTQFDNPAPAEGVVDINFTVDVSGAPTVTEPAA